ncbi:MAG: glycosyltransferase [Saprospiraceae bacterium]|nr:glycosyltransferase [Saprospiraceae bacterium]
MKSNREPIKILFITHSLGSGGAEKVFQLLMNNLDRRRFQVQCILINRVQHNAFLKDDIVLHELHASSTIRAIGKIRKVIKKRKPDLVVGTVSPVNLLMPIIKISLPRKHRPSFINRESTLMSYLVEEGSIKNVLIKTWTRLFYSHYARIICQSNDICNDLINNFYVDKLKLTLINNPMERSEVPKIRSGKNQRIKIITVGRLRPEKGYDRLLDIIKAFDNRAKHDFLYHVVGDFHTPEIEERIMRKVNELGLMDRIVFHGHMDTPMDELQNSDLFLQGSYFEGFPNAVLESCAAGVPVVAYDVPGGTKEIIRHGFNGYLVEDNNVDEFVDKMLLALETQWNPLNMAEDIHQRFGQEKILEQYQNLFLDVFFQKSNQ